ncbi:MAG: CDGSH iron-sulfur domain-containing protein [Gemmatimonadaceae bacterium]|jgi:CDGSH-type Zn-finger protein|nr:CDGSH iron-sulfur domain-containing protein [Gemmatimonadaceae bacterium]
MAADEAAADARCTIACRANGPLLVRGPFRLVDAEGRVVFAGTARALCRCGASRELPFCDGTHHVIGFRAD